MDNYGFWCDGISAEDMCNKVYDALRKNVIALKTNTMIVFTYGDCWSFLDLDMDSLLRIKNFFDASFVEAGYKDKEKIEMIKNTNKDPEDIYILDLDNIERSTIYNPQKYVMEENEQQMDIRKNYAFWCNKDDIIEYIICQIKMSLMQKAIL